jgi:hypothetical protein
VVAEAVRNLAGRSASAAKDITTLIRDSVEKTARGAAIAEESGKSLASIVTSVQKVADLNHQIAVASQEQASGISQISKAMNQLDQATQGNAAAAEESAASSEEMSAQAGQLDALVQQLSEVLEGQRTRGESHKVQAAAPQATLHATPAHAGQSPKLKVVAGGKKDSPKQVIPLDDDAPKASGGFDGF